jgi:hypothetical protein
VITLECFAFLRTGENDEESIFRFFLERSCSDGLEFELDRRDFSSITHHKLENIAPKIAL